MKQEKDEAIVEKINSLADEDGDKPEEAQGQATPSTTEGDEVKTELVAAEIIKDDDSSVLKVFVEDSLKPDIVYDEPNQPVSFN